MSRESDLNKFRQGLEEGISLFYTEIDQEVKRTASLIQTEVVQRTRIKTGRAKSNWHIELGGPNFDVDSSIDDEDPGTWIGAGEALSRAKGDVSNLDRNNSQQGELYDIYVSSGVDYITILEDRDAMAEGTVHWAATFLPVVVTGAVERT